MGGVGGRRPWEVEKGEGVRSQFKGQTQASPGCFQRGMPLAHTPALRPLSGAQDTSRLVTRFSRAGGRQPGCPWSGGICESSSFTCTFNQESPFSAASCRLRREGPDRTAAPEPPEPPSPSPAGCGVWLLGAPPPRRHWLCSAHHHLPALKCCCRPPSAVFVPIRFVLMHSCLKDPILGGETDKYECSVGQVSSEVPFFKVPLELHFRNKNFFGPHVPLGKVCPYGQGPPAPLGCPHANQPGSRSFPSPTQEVRGAPRVTAR